MRVKRHNNDNVTIYADESEWRELCSATDLEYQIEKDDRSGLLDLAVRRAHDCWGARVVLLTRSQTRYLAYCRRFARRLRKSREDIRAGRVVWISEPRG